MYVSKYFENYLDRLSKYKVMIWGLLPTWNALWENIDNINNDVQLWNVFKAGRFVQVSLLITQVCK